MGKVKLPKNVAKEVETKTGFYACEGIAYLMFELTGAPTATSKWVDSEKDNIIKLAEALVNGYEIEVTPEDKVRELFEQGKKFDKEWRNPSVINAITDTLNALNIKIEGVNA